MPRRTSTSRRGGKMRGKGAFLNFFKKVGKWFKDNKVISKVGNALGSVGVPYASKIGSVAGTLGYGRRRRGGSLRLAGNGLSLAGSGRRCRRK
jgi:hypothetical protein